MSPTSSKSFTIECAKAALLVAMGEVAAQHKDHVKVLALLVDPQAAVAKKQIKSGSLTLACCSPSSKVSNKADVKKVAPSMVEAKVELEGGHAMSFMLSPHFVAPLKDDGSKHDSPFVNPFWFCTKVDEGANMTMSLQRHEVSPFICFVPILVNKKGLKEHDVLCFSSKQSGPQAKKAKTE